MQTTEQSTDSPLNEGAMSDDNKKDLLKQANERIEKLSALHMFIREIVAKSLDDSTVTGEETASLLQYQEKLSKWKFYLKYGILIAQSQNDYGFLQRRMNETDLGVYDDTTVFSSQVGVPEQLNSSKIETD